MARLKCPCLQVSRQMPGCYHNGEPSSGAGRLLLAKKLHNAKIVHNFELCVLHCTECVANVAQNVRQDGVPGSGSSWLLPAHRAATSGPAHTKHSQCNAQLCTSCTFSAMHDCAHQTFSVQCTTLSALHYIARKCTLSAFSVNKLQVFSVCCILCAKLRTVCIFCLHISAS